jgi:putative transposase
MVNMPQKKIKNHLSNNELSELIKIKKHDCQMFKKLSLIRDVKNGKKVADVCDVLQISETTGHNWVDNYNEKGLSGLKPNYSNNGRKAKLSDEQKEELVKILENETFLKETFSHYFYIYSELKTLTKNWLTKYITKNFCPRL